MHRIMKITFYIYPRIFTKKSQKVAHSLLNNNILFLSLSFFLFLETKVVTYVLFLSLPPPPLLPNFPSALSGKQADFRSLVSSKVKWEDLPLVNTNKGVEGVLEVLDSSRSFLLDPRLSVTKKTLDQAKSQV